MPRQHKILHKNIAQQSVEAILIRKEDASTSTRVESVHELWLSKRFNFNHWSSKRWFCFFTHGLAVYGTNLIFRWLCRKLFSFGKLWVSCIKILILCELQAIICSTTSLVDCTGRLAVSIIISKWDAFFITCHLLKNGLTSIIFISLDS